MPRITRDIMIHAPREAVFAALVDPTARATWLTSMKETATEDTLSVGSRIPARRRAAGSRSTYALTVTALEAPARLVTAVARNGVPAGTGGYELTPRDGGTLARAWAEYALKGVQRVMGPVVAAGLERELNADLASLKAFVESGT